MNAGGGNGNSTIAETNIIENDLRIFAGSGNNSEAYVSGPDNSTATAQGSNDVAYVYDPYGMGGPADQAISGYGGNNDVAEVLFTQGTAVATGHDFAVDILTPLGEAGPAAVTAASDSGNLWTELASLF